MNEFLSFNIGQLVQVVVVLVTIGMMYQGIRGDIKNQNERLERIEEEISDFRKLLVQNARFEERLMNLQSMVIAQGKRLDRYNELQEISR